jgi:Asp-tRNA(Asn)/Glu-tRNA(Gln) amidotransferase A subunit family amidase
MRNSGFFFWLPGLGAALALLVAGCGKAGSSLDGFEVVEATIAEIHAAYRAGTLTCRRLTEAYLERIERYDRRSRLNAVVTVNPGALARADELDDEFKRTGELRPLHGIPVIVKDNYETRDMATTAGSEALAGFIPPDDAFQVRRLREAGAVILAKSNMAEWAFSPYQTQSSIAGITRNPYDLNKVPAGSSGGTAAAVAANFAVAGLGTDTGNSIRGPASHCCLAGIRPSMGLASRDGIIPLYRRNDVGGPMCRTLEDAARVLQVIAGFDPADPVTEMSKGRIPESYLEYLDPNGLAGARLGVFRFFTDLPHTDPEVEALFNQALEDMKTAGAIVVDPFTIPDFGKLTRNLWCDTFQHDVNAYFASLGDRAPVEALIDVYNSKKFSLYIKERLYRALGAPVSEDQICADIFTEPRNIAFRDAVLAAMADQGVDFIVYPTWNNPPRPLASPQYHPGDNSQLIPPHTGMPALSIPMGFTKDGLPTGLQIVARNFAEPDLFRVAFAFESATRHRRPPKRFD